MLFLSLYYLIPLLNSYQTTGLAIWLTMGFPELCLIKRRRNQEVGGGVGGGGMREEDDGEERKGQEEQRGEPFVLFAAVCNLINFIQCPVHSNITSHSTSLHRIHHFLGALWQESSSRNYQRFLSDFLVPLSTSPVRLFRDPLGKPLISQPSCPSEFRVAL